MQTLEPRLLLAGLSAGVYASFNASETDPLRAGRGEFIFKRPTGSTVEPLTLDYYIRSTSTATSGADFQPLSGSVTIPAGKRSAAINVFAIDDAIHEPVETLALVLKDGAFENIHRWAFIEIADNDSPVTARVGVYAGFPNASETNPTTTGRGQLLFKRPVGSTLEPLTLSYYIRTTSTATSGSDFQPLSGSATIPAGKRSVAVDVFPIDDNEVEPDETIVVVLRDGAYANIHRIATITIASNDVTSPPPPLPEGWWDGDWSYRQPIAVSVGAYARTNMPVEQAINFTNVLSNLGRSGSLVESSIRVIEVSSDGLTPLNENIPFQFDKAPDYNASTNASGKLVLMLNGTTAAGATRKFHVYFDTKGTFSAPSFASLVSTDPAASDEGRAAIRVRNNTATYWLQRENGGFSSIVDEDGNDWLGFDPTPGSQAGGEFRGTPNAVFPGGGFHAGFSVGSTEIINAGPLKTTIESTVSVDRQIPGSPFTYRMRYEFYPDFVRATILQADSSYWFLYEGTPGGAVDDDDTVVRSDGAVTSISTSWDDNDGLGSGNGEEWLYFRDAEVNKFIYFVHDEPDNLKDSYYRMNANGSMTVFGFGRDNSVGVPNNSLMSEENNSFTFGIASGGGNFSAASALINGHYRTIGTSLGTPLSAS